MKPFFISICIFITAWMMPACDVINPVEDIPAYIEIKDIDFYITDPTTQGSASHKISDAWVYIDDHPIGVFELPARFPVLYEGKHTLKIKAGVWNTGFSRIRTAYPFYDFYINDSTFHLFPDSVVPVHAVVTYYSVSVFKWIEDFEDVGISIDSVSGSDVNIVRVLSGENVFEGNGSGALYLTPEHAVFRGLSAEKFELPQGGQAVFLEMDYKTSTDFQLRLWANEGMLHDEYELITLIPKTNAQGKTQWNKIYIELTDAVLAMPSAETYQIEFIADGGSSGGEVFVDNLKLIHQP